MIKIVTWKIYSNKVLACHYFSSRQSRFPPSPVKEPTTNQPLLLISRFHGFHLLPFSALQAALQLAEEISSFPQQCLRADRSSAFYSSYDAPSFKQVKPCHLYSAMLGRSRRGGPLLNQNRISKTFLRNSRRCSMRLTAGVPSCRQNLSPAPPGSPKEQEEEEHSHRAAACTGHHPHNVTPVDQVQHFLHGCMSAKFWSKAIFFLLLCLTC